MYIGWKKKKRARCRLTEAARHHHTNFLLGYKRKKAHERSECVFARGKKNSFETFDLVVSECCVDLSVERLAG